MNKVISLTNHLVETATTNRKEIGRFIKFSFVGKLGAIIDFGVLNLLVQLASFPKMAANVFSFSTAVVSNFIWNRLWVYPETRDDSLRKQFVQFSLVNVVGLFINTTIFSFADRWLLGEMGLLARQMAALASRVGMAHFDLAYNGAKIIATSIVLFWNFFINRFWTFRHVG